MPRFLALLIVLCGFLPAAMRAQTTFEKMVYTSDATSESRTLICQEFSDGKGYVCVNEDRGGATNAYLQLRCFDVSGNIVWEKRIDVADEVSLQSFSIGRRYELIISYIGVAGTGLQRTAGVIKLDRYGNIIWHKFYRSAGRQDIGAYAVYEQANGELLMHGFCNTSDHNGHYVMRLSVDGKPLDCRFIHETVIWGVAQPAKDGGLYIFCSEGLMKVDQNLAVLWFRSFPAGMRHSQVCATDENNNFYTVLSTGNPSSSVLLCWNQTGQLVWGRSLGFVNVQNMEVVQQRILLFGGVELHVLDKAGNWVQSHQYSNYYTSIAKACGNQFWLMGLASHHSRFGMAMALVNQDGGSSCSVPGSDPGISALANPPVIRSLGSSNIVLPFTEQSVNAPIKTSSSLTDTLCPGKLSSAFSIGPDTAFCQGDSIKLDAGVDAAFYEWSNGASSRSIKINKGGMYWVQVKGTCFGDARDTLQVKEQPAPTAQFTTHPVPALPGDELTLTDISQGIQQRTWTLPGGSTGSDSVIQWQVPNSGKFKFNLKVCDSNTCCSQREEELEVNFFSLYVPSAFSPGDDRLNDVFAPQGYGISQYVLSIFNRWGQLLYKGENKGWDGFYNEQPAQEGMYYYLLQARNQEGRYARREGYLYLVR